MSDAELTREDIFELIPEDAVKVRVLTAEGEETWRHPNDVLDDDQVVMHQGQPRVMSKTGAKPFKDALPGGESPAIEATMIAKKRAMKKDPLRRVIDEKPESRDVLHEVMRAMAEESASLEFERKEAERKGEDTRPISVSRLQALKAVGDTWIRRIDQITVKGVDLESPQFRALLKVLIKTFRESMVSAGCRREQIDGAVAHLAKMLNSSEWETEAVSAMKV